MGKGSEKGCSRWVHVLWAVFIVGFFLRGLLVNESSALRAVDTHGFTNAQVVAKHWMFVGLQGCDGADAAMFEVVANNPAKKVVNLKVCVGWPFKGATIRTD